MLTRASRGVPRALRECARLKNTSHPKVAYVFEFIKGLGAIMMQYQVVSNLQGQLTKP